MSAINIQLNDDACSKALATTAQTEQSINNTSKALQQLLLTSNMLRQKTEKVVDGMEAVPRTKALEHALITQTTTFPARGI